MKTSLFAESIKNTVAKMEKIFAEKNERIFGEKEATTAATSEFLPTSSTLTNNKNAQMEQQVLTNSNPDPSSLEFNVVTENQPSSNSSPLGILLLQNARRKLQLEEERTEFEKEKELQREKDKLKLKFFLRLNQRILETTGTEIMMDIPTAAGDGASLKSMDENDVFTGDVPTFFDDTIDVALKSRRDLTPSTSEEETLEEKVDRLEIELIEMQQHAAESDAECQHLRKLQKNLDDEVQDLTETLFQQAYRIADQEVVKRKHAEKLLAEALMKVDLLQAEVKGLKDIVKSPARRTLTNLKDRVGREISQKLSDFPVYFQSPSSKLNSLLHPNSTPVIPSKSCSTIVRETPKVDSPCFTEFKEWLIASNPYDMEIPFLKRLMVEDVTPCLTFVNHELASEVLEAIKRNSLEMQPYHDEAVRKCELTQIETICHYRLRTDSDKEWVFISLQARYRVTAVCDMFTYLRYIQTGIVKGLPQEAYHEITSMRKNMLLARFGFDFVTKMNGRGLTTTPTDDDNHMEE